ncbi:MAG: thiaminase II [Candidatus Nitrosopolaris wilkensis]|nr:MAG: thiaminase II [Candidatus Nitrosopolaris wilkensis]
MAITFAETLKHHSIETWKKILSHSFISELSKGTLPLNKFVFYLKQDHYFLEQFSKFLQFAKLKTKDSKMKGWFDSLYVSTVDFEMEMQTQIFNSLSVSASSSSNNTTIKHDIFPSKTILEYTSYLIHISSTGTFSNIVSVMAPCPWTYLEIAQKLSEIPIGNEAYRKWVQFYSSTESRRQVDEIKQILDLLGEKGDQKSKDLMKSHFVTACKYEYFFWEAAYNLRNQ